MDGVAKAIKKNVGSKAAIENLVKTLDGQKKILRDGAGKVDEKLQEHGLSPVHHAAGWAYMLNAKAQNLEIKDHNLFIEQCRVLCAEGTQEQLSLVPKQLSQLVDKYVESLLITERTIEGVAPLRSAVEKVSENPHEVTPVHAAFALVCLKSSCYDYALPVLDTLVFNVNPERSGLKPVDFLSYFYYAGMIYTGLKRYPRAVECYRQTLNISTSHLSVVQVNAYRKLILVSLLADAKMPSFDKLAAVTNQAQSKLQALSMQYHALADNYKFEIKALTNVAQQYAEVFSTHTNLGLVKQVLKSHKRRTIRKLTDTYVTLSLDDMAGRAGLKSVREAERYILGMIADGEIFASLDQKNGMITFQDDPENFDTRAMVDSLDAKVREIIFLNAKLQELNLNTVVSKKYVERTLPKTVEEEAKNDPALAQALAASRVQQ